MIKRIVKHLIDEIILKALINRTRNSLLILKINYSTTVYLILFKVMWTEKYLFSITSENYTSYFLKITPVRCPSRLMHWCTRLKTLSITRSNMVGGILISSEILCLWLCKSAGRVWNTQNAITSRHIGWTGWPRNIAVARDYMTFKHGS